MKNQLTRKDESKGTPKLGPCWKSQPATYRVNLEWKLELNLEFVNKDNSHSWVTISHGFNKLVTDLSNNKGDDNNEPENYSPIAYPVSKQLSTLLRHGDLLRKDDGAIEF